MQVTRVRAIALLTDYLIGQRGACASDPFRALKDAIACWWFEDTSGEVNCYLSQLRCVEKYTIAVTRGKEWFKFLIYGTCTRNAPRIPMPSRLLLWLSLAGEYRNNITVAALLQLSCYLGCYSGIPIFRTSRFFKPSIFRTSRFFEPGRFPWICFSQTL